MGETDAVKAMLKRALAFDFGANFDDQAVLASLVKETPEKFALDAGETLFLSMSRGWVRKTEGWICNFGKDQSETCGPPKKNWGSCELQSKFINVHIQADGKATELKPLVIHMN